MPGPVTVSRASVRKQSPTTLRDWFSEVGIIVEQPPTSFRDRFSEVVIITETHSHSMVRDRFSEMGCHE